MTINYAALTKKGPGRKENEDRIAIAGTVLCEGAVEGAVEGGLLAVVCDGVGGTSSGARAASLASGGFTSLIDESNPPLSIFRQIELADEELRAESAGGTGGRLASTLAGVYIDDGECIVFNAGDTRVYEVDEDGPRLVSDDHTRAQAMIDASFACTPEELPTKTQHTIVRYLGGDGVCKPAFAMKPADGRSSRMLVCSDGAYRALGEDGLRNAVAKSATLLDCCRSVYGEALAAGSDDDVSIVILERAG